MSHLNVESLIHHYGDLGIFFILFTEMVGIPFPAETTLTVSGFEWSQGALPLFPIALAAITGNIAGSSVAYAIGRFLGRPVVLAAGKYVGITAEKLNSAEQRFQKSERWIVLVAKFIAGIRVLVPYLAGINKMRFTLFSLFNGISAILWVLLFLILGRYLGFAWTRYHRLLHHSVIYIVAGIVVLTVVWIFVARRRHEKKRNSRE